MTKRVRAGGWVALRMIACGVMALALAAGVSAASFGIPGGAAPANLDELMGELRQDAYDMELLISFGTSKGGSAGHLALALRDAGGGDDSVYSANFYADRGSEHATGFYTKDLMVRIPKKEYLYGTTSSLDETASFGLDFGEVYKRSVVGIRIYGVPANEREALAAFFQRINDDYHGRAKQTEYHDDEVKYGYMHLNCAKTIGSGFRYGAGYEDLVIKSPRILSGRRVVAAVNANIPTEMAMKLLAAWSTRGYGLDAVLYRKYPASRYVDQHDEEKIAFKDLPNRFPSVLSLDFRSEEGEYEDYDNLFAMYLLYNLARYSVRMDAPTGMLAMEQSKAPMTYAEAVALAKEQAEQDSRGLLGRVLFRPKGKAIGAPANAPDAQAP